MFEFLFNYRSDLFAEGELALLAGPLRIALVAIGVAFTLWALMRYRTALAASEKVDGRAAVLLLGIRLLGVAALVFALLEPALVLQALKPQESFVAVLADTSSSMTIADTHEIDGPASTRAEWLERALVIDDADEGSGTFWRSLADRFQVRAYAFSGDTKRLDLGERPSFEGRSSDLGKALNLVRSELTGVPLAGVVVLTDGAISSSELLTDETLRLRSSKIPVFPVAIGSPRFARDLEVREIRLPRRVLLGSTIEAAVLVNYPGFGGETVRIEVRDAGRVIDQRQIELPPSGDETITVELSFRAQTEGTRSLEFLVVPIAPTAEAVELNNNQTVLVEVESGPHKILYFEGEPRFEYKFIRRAVADDPQLQLVSLLRMADNRFYRQSVDGEDELRGGFPTRREELFKYKGLVIGSVEASFFTYEQMRMIVDFAAERGGGVLFLGGSQSLGEGGFAGTPLSELVPVELSDRRELGPRGISVSVRPTPLGQTHPVLDLGSADRPSDDAFWASLPELLLLNRTGRVKPGAAALLTGLSQAGDEEFLVLAQQRFGSGSSMIFLPTDSFRWQMRLDTADQTHEVLWRQLLRWLINGVEERMVASARLDRVEVGERVGLVSLVKDHRFQPDSNSVVDAEVTTPSGLTTTLSLGWDPLEDGRYFGEFEPEEAGQHTVRVVAESQSAAAAFGEPTAVSEFRFSAGPLDREFFGAVQQPEVLDRLASETGGQRFSARELEQLIDELSYSSSGVTVREERPLWNMPILFFVMLSALLAEWTTRRIKGLR